MQLPAISHDIWEKKYQLKQQDGTPLETTIEQTWRRVATALGDGPVQQQKFFQSFQDFKFLPAGRITAGAGTGRAVTLFNCFVMGTVPDNMGGIFDAVREAALTMQQGGGIGYDFSTIRPRGAEVKGVAADASGPLSFMDVWDSMCKTILSAGNRRGAMMATLRCDHPDVEDFIESKRDPLRLRNFNLSVLITDPFMAAVKNDVEWHLHFDGKTYKTIRARDLWDQMMQNTYDFAEPGVIFIDRINQTNNLRDVETIAATNPCGEQPLPPYGACLLGSINIAALVEHPFNPHIAGIDYRRLDLLVATAVEALDRVVDVSLFPLPAQEQEAKDKRRLGLGVTGLADALLMMGITYGSDEAVVWTKAIMKRIAHAAYQASVNLAKNDGAFPLFDADEFLAPGTAASTLDPELKADIRKYGVRNSHLTSIAPTGTISLYAGNVSSGIEPVFAYEYTRKVTQKDGTKRDEKVVDYAVQMWRDLHGDTPLPDYFVSAQTLPPEAHVRMQAAAQEWVDSSISKTINVPEDISFEDFKAVYLSAWDQGCKGCTTYRPNLITGSVLSVEPAPVAPTTPTLADRPETVEGATYKLKWPGSDHALYVTINDLNGQPFEIFINSKNVEHFAWTVGLTRMISAVFRRGGDVSFVAEELKAVFDPRGGAWIGGKYIPSMLAAIGGVIEQHMGLVGQASEVAKAPMQVPGLAPGPMCPACSSTNVEKKAGCFTCNDCGDSKCG